DYESVAAVKPDIIYVQLPGFGSDPTKPYYPFVAWGPNQAPLVGLEELTGHGGREPSGISTLSIPDYTSALHATTAVLCGLEHRDRTGEGVHVDVSQFETTIGLLGPLVMNHELTGESQERVGNRSLWHAPEGVYPCAGGDELREEWIAISADCDEAWAVIAAMAGPDLADDPRFATMADRMANQDALDEAMGRWTASWDKVDLATRLQKAGVPAHMVSTNEDLIHDEHVKQRRWYEVNPSGRFRRDLYSTNAIRMSDTPGYTTRGGPVLGEHTVEVLTEAGLSPEEVNALIAGGEAFTMTEPGVIIDRPYEEWLHILFPDEPDTRDLP
ncbi:MAG: hypothetical protein GY929_23245, partial [Actinomycetia bacterium]|nr:hypothetical protein [Actinomycetes bacterium]